MGKILVMMIGELDYTDLLVADWSNEVTVPLPMITIGLFFLFVLTVSVVLVNLLVGTAKLLLPRRATVIMYPRLFVPIIFLSDKLDTVLLTTSKG